MNEQKMMQLTNEEAAKLFSKGCDTAVEANRMMDEFNNGGILIKPIESKLVHLSDLPEGTRIENREYDENGSSVTDAYAADGGLFLYKSPYGEYINPIAIDEIRLLPGEFQVWQGGVFPWPAHVEVEVECVRFKNGDVERFTLTGDARHIWRRENRIIAHRCTGRLLQGAKLVS